MEQLKNATNADIVKVLEKLGASSIYTVNMVMKPALTYAETQKISKYNYEIRVDHDRYTSGTKLFKATALIHEVIHAYLLKRALILLVQILSIVLHWVKMQMAQLLKHQ